MFSLKNAKARITALFLLSFIILLAVFGASVFLGSVNISPGEVINGLLGKVTVL